MRMGEADRQAERAVVFAAAVIIDLAYRLKGDVVVILHLVGDFRDASPGDGAHVVIPPVNPLSRLAVIRCPAEIGRVNVGGQALLETVHLVRSDKVHLARQACRVARPPQMVRVGRNVRRKLGSVIINARAARQLPGHEAGPPRCAQRRGGVAVLKPDGTLGECLQMRSMQEIRGAIRKQGAVQLIDHQYQDVFLSGHIVSPSLRKVMKETCPLF
jgi:hypothetical protein